MKSAAKAKKPVAEIKEPGAKAGKRKANVGKKGEDAAEFRINEPVLDPIGDVISGEARSYLGEPENLGKVEMDAYREETEDSAVDGTLEPGPGMAAASGADADAGGGARTRTKRIRALRSGHRRSWSGCRRFCRKPGLRAGGARRR